MLTQSFSQRSLKSQKDDIQGVLYAFAVILVIWLLEYFDVEYLMVNGDHAGNVGVIPAAV